MVLSGREKATIFLSLLGAETSAKILRYLPNELADLIAAGVNHLPTPSPEALAEVLSEFKGFVALPSAPAAAAPRIEAPKEEPQPAAKTSGRIYQILSKERPQMAAFLLSVMPEEERDTVISSLQRDRLEIEDFLYAIKPNPLTPKLEANLKKLFAGRLYN